MVICFWCGTQLDNANRSKDHLIPASMGGTKDESNIVYACRPCNVERGRIPNLYFLYMRLKKYEKGFDYSGQTLTEKKKIVLLRTIKHWKYIRYKHTKLIKKWIDLELSKLGYSPSKNIVEKIHDFE